MMEARHYLAIRTQTSMSKEGLFAQETVAVEEYLPRFAVNL